MTSMTFERAAAEDSQHNDLQLHQEHVILVLGGGGLDQDIQIALRETGATVIGTAHRAPADPVDGVEIEITDLEDTAAVQALIERVHERHGRIDSLIGIVGGFAGGSFIQSDQRTWAEVIDVRLHVAVQAIRLTLPGMIERSSGRIVLIGAQPAVNLAPNSDVDAAAHSAIVAMTRTVARETQQTGVTVNCILTGTTDTPQNRELKAAEDPGAWVTPREIGRVVAFLCTDDARLIQGAVIPMGVDL